MFVVVVSIVLVGTPTRCESLHTVSDLRATQMNVQRCLIRELIPYEFEQGHNSAKSIINVCCTKNEGAVDHSTVSRLFKKCCSDCKDLDNQARSGRSKSVDSEAVSKVAYGWLVIFYGLSTLVGYLMPNAVYA